MRRTALTPLLLPLALAAVPCLAETFPERWRARVATFERENARLDPTARNVVLLGSSSMEGWRYSRRAARFLPEGWSFLNRGISGDGIGLSKTTGIKNRLECSVFDCNPSHVFILNGRNSIGRDGRQVEATARVYREVIEAIQARLPDVVVCVVTCSPVRGSYEVMAPHVVSFNERLGAIAADLGCPLIDLHALLVGEDGLLPPALTPDGLHFKDAGYRVLAGEIARVLGEHPYPRVRSEAESSGLDEVPEERSRGGLAGSLDGS